MAQQKRAALMHWHAITIQTPAMMTGRAIGRVHVDQEHFGTKRV